MLQGKFQTKRSDNDKRGFKKMKSIENHRKVLHI